MSNSGGDGPPAPRPGWDGKRVFKLAVPLGWDGTRVFKLSAPPGWYGTRVFKLSAPPGWYGKRVFKLSAPPGWYGKRVFAGPVRDRSGHYDVQFWREQPASAPSGTVVVTALAKLFPSSRANTSPEAARMG